jgi:hypothetical protein
MFLPRFVDSTSLTFPPVGITHIAGDISDLIRHKAVGRRALEINTSAQPNSDPHLGSITTLCATFALAEHFQASFGLPARVTFDSLENSPGSFKECGVDIYQKDLAHTFVVKEDGTSCSKEEFFLASFADLLGFLSKRTGVPYRIRPYREFGMLPAFRGALMTVLHSSKLFSPIVSPKDRMIHVRKACPVCQWVHKNSQPKVTEVAKRSLKLKFECPDHGQFDACLSVHHGDLFDTGTSVREVCKAAVMIADRKQDDALVVMVDGADWSGNWALMVYIAGAHRLDLPFELLPERFFTPTILDWSGGKFSKSLYIKGGEYDEIPEFLLNYRRLVETLGIEAIDVLLAEARNWVADPKRFMRNYSISYIMDLFRRSGFAA